MIKKASLLAALLVFTPPVARSAQDDVSALLERREAWDLDWTRK